MIPYQKGSNYAIYMMAILKEPKSHKSAPKGSKYAMNFMPMPKGLENAIYIVLA